MTPFKKEKDHLGRERRNYVRLDSVFPVSFKLINPGDNSELSEWMQGFTNNVGKGGLCLAVNNLKPYLASLIRAKQAKLVLNIEMPLGKIPVQALAGIAWVKEIPEEPEKLLIGLHYEEIVPQHNLRIMRYAVTKRMFVPALVSAIFILGIGFLVNGYFNFKLIQGNKTLVKQLITIIQETVTAKQKIGQIDKEKKDFELKIQALQMRSQVLEEEKQKAKEEAKKSEELNAAIGQLTREKAALQADLISLQQKETGVTEELLDLNLKRGALEKINYEKMYQWLAVHQNPRTGLVISFEGDNDIAGWAFTYDQSLAAQAYTYFNDFERSRKLLDFFQKKAKRQGGLFFNAYYSGDGQPAEYTVHCGPNLWLGIAVSQYTQKTKDQRYMAMGEEIAGEIIALQDSEGGLRGGPQASWYSTEHNLDAYAFFDMLYKITAKPKYLQARDKILAWVIKHTYDESDIPIKRGKGDSTIATDTYAWAIAAIGPEKLEEVGMSPERIMEFAEEHCAVEVPYSRPDGLILKVKGFDFAAQRNLARGGVVSSEWTAQMVLSFKIMADFYYKKNMENKAKVYAAKAEEYLGELGSMVISSPSPSGQGESCLSYATSAHVDTGHGWMTPKGDSTGSVAGTAYTLFAYYGYNPLELEARSGSGPYN